VALVSDAGTPGISDPGYRLVRDARAEGLPVVPVPGASAAVAALSVSGLPTDRFLFVGFLPARAGGRRQALEELAARRETLVFHESPLRAAAALRDMAQAFGDREAFLCREATKLHEEYRRGRLAELAAELEARAAVKGEIVLVVAGAPEAAAAGDREEISVESAFAELVAQGRTRRQAAKELARRLGLPAREVYRRTLGQGGDS
jgi:16S rRNA (cytidine1402-2'-O)-methyltransferase